jgi:hypothetical protein
MYPIAKLISRHSQQSFAIQTGFSQDTQLVPTLNNGLTFDANLTNPFPEGITPPSGASLGAATFLGRGIRFYNPADAKPYTMQWSFNIQTMLPGQFLLETGYIGTKSLKLEFNRNLNALPNQYLSTSPVRDQGTIDYLTAQIPNPFAGLLPKSGLNSVTIPRSQLLLPYPQFSSVTMTDYQGWAWYNSLQVRLERRFSKGFTIIAGYTFSKNIDATTYLNAGDSVPTKAISALDRSHLMFGSAIWELPFGKGKPLLSGANRAANAFVGGWQLSGVWQLNTGFPIAFGNVLFNGNIKDIALPKDKRTVDRWFNTDAGFVRDTRQQLAYNLQTFPIRLAGVRTGRYNSQNISLLKNIVVHERHRLQFRAELYNAFNHPSAADRPNTDPTSSAFGGVISMSYLPRQVQLGIKYLF